MPISSPEKLSDRTGSDLGESVKYPWPISLLDRPSAAHARWPRLAVDQLPVQLREALRLRRLVGFSRLVRAGCFVADDMRARYVPATGTGLRLVRCAAIVWPGERRGGASQQHRGK